MFAKLNKNEQASIIIAAIKKAGSERKLAESLEYQRVLLIDIRQLENL